VDPLLIAFGLGVGLLVGMTGVGGGSLMTPLLILVTGVSPVTAVGSDLAYAAVTKTVGGVKHLRQHTVAVRLSCWMAVGSVPAALCGVYALEALQRSQGSEFDDLLLTIVAAAILLTGTVTLARALFLPGQVEHERADFELRPRHRVAAVIVGIFVGFVLGMTSAGSGALIAMALILIFRLIPTRVVGTDVFHAAILLWAAALAHIVAGNVDYALVGTLLVGSIPGVWVGAHMSVRVPHATLRLGLGVVLLGAGLALLSKAAVPIPTPVVAAAPLALLVLVLNELVGRSGHRRAPPGIPETARRSL
jgi:uncharacterized protein